MCRKITFIAVFGLCDIKTYKNSDSQPDKGYQKPVFHFWFLVYQIIQVSTSIFQFIKDYFFMEANKPKNKQSFCRFYLRGLCIYNANQCEFSHGVWDLDYDYWKEDEVIQYDYHKNKDDSQKNYIKGPRIYLNLYQFQVEKICSLEELSENRSLRSEIRNMMHQQLYQQFMQLLEIKHPGIVFTEEFLVREYTRAGFNKILMGAMKFNHIVSYLCEVPNSKYFKTMKVILPNQGKQNIIARKATDEQIIAAYKQLYQKLIQQSNNKQIEESVIKKHLFTAILPENVPPLNLVLKDKKLNLTDFISKMLGEETGQIISQTSIENIHSEAIQYLKNNLSQNLVSWNQLYNHLSKALKTNNGNILNQVKPHLVLENYLFLFFPMIQFIYNKKINSQSFKHLKDEPCQCDFRKPYSEQQLLLQAKKQQLKEGESININNFQSLILCAPHILSSQVLGVDLQGNLRRGGFVQMIQLNNGRNTFLIDIWDMNERGEFQTFWLARKILRNVMVNPKITKIFHDCRHDSIGLHEMIETCIVNVFDTSACQTLINQLSLYQDIVNKKQKQTINDCKNAISQCNNVKTPGLNEILKKYEARHGINKNKDKYHKMWSKGDISFFCKRPIDPDYREYCIKDVLDLPEVFAKMLSCLPEESVDLAFWISGMYAKQGYLASEENMKQKMEK